MFTKSVSTYKKKLVALKKYRAALGLPESLSIDLLLSEVQLILEATGQS